MERISYRNLALQKEVVKYALHANIICQILVSLKQFERRFFNFYLEYNSVLMLGL